MSAVKDTRKREVNEKVGKTTAKVKKRRSEVAAGKRKLDDLHESHSDSSKPEEKAEYEKLEAEVTKLDAELMEWEAELGELEKEQKDIDRDTIMDHNENKEDDSVDELFVGSSSNKTTQPPQFDLTGPDGKSNALIVGDSDDEEAVFTPAQAREATGQSHDGKIVAWRQQDRSKPVIVRYGPQNAAKYERSTAAKEGNDFDEEETEEFGPDHRLGDQKVAKKFVRKRRELLGIAGLAYNCDLKDLEPREKGEARRVSPLEIWVKWEISGAIYKTWEIRSSIRHLFSSAKKADAYIYEAAKWHAARHQEWQNGQREAKERSPTLVPNSQLSPTPEPKKPEVKIEGASDGSSLVVTNSSVESKSAKRAAMLQYREQWCDLKGIDPEFMDPAAEGRFLKAWNEIRDTL
ncbi:uncharacterized protein RAG0_12595 [Rhynchosporium agropyri]|uniref:Uncharacterized protein n=1 Tax=Rhynchosporium agropyri TaxID=914238 RepID=A0A1E1LBE2_9HELO|nr:uncharacterized protein RAG0_12595 [Rhynchosporium agropyri]